MDNFFPNQRYTSKGEPELGVGILTALSKGKVELHFPASNETRLYAVESAVLQRVVFKPGDITLGEICNLAASSFVKTNASICNAVSL